MKRLSWLLLPLLLSASGPAQDDAARITVKSDGAFLARMDLPSEAFYEFTTHGSVAIVTEEGEESTISGDVPTITLIGGQEWEERGVQVSRERRLTFSAPVEVVVKQGSLELLRMNVKKAEITVSH